MPQLPRRKTILMCPPDHFGVAYVINPWMEGQYARTDAEEARVQWFGLKRLVEAQADVRLLDPHPDLPDLVFTANAGLPRGDKVVLSRFRCPERRGEEAIFRSFFTAHGFEIIDPPPSLFFEGAGDALYDGARDLYWVGHGFRSHRDAAPFLEKTLGARTLSLALIDPRFYHLDTCLCPLPGGFLLYFPGAFDAPSRAAIEAHVAPEQRIEADSAEAESFCCNAVAVNDRVLLNAASPRLRQKIASAGFQVESTPLTQFMKAGGAAKCLTLEL
ncbi:MAG TPA: arginine deiminase-related protein [Rhodoblastus sp.]|nr:arginine deiminase-related protein [Rhodoblastus sp.]